MGVHGGFCDFLENCTSFGEKSFEQIQKYKMSAAFDMGPAGRVSPLVKTARWTLLIAGIWWGSKRYAQLKTIEDERRAYEAKMKPIWDAEKAVKKEAANRESMLSLAAAAGVKVPADF